MEQAEIRKKMIAERKSVPLERAAAAAKSVAKTVFSFPEVQSAQTVMVYLPVRGELNTAPLIQMLKNAGKTVLYPVTKGEELVAAMPESEDFTKGDFGVSVPCVYREIDCPDVVIVPLSAADLRRYRIGYGKGYYDRFLSEKTCFTVGVCYDFQVVEKLRENPWEKPLSAIVGESTVIRE